MAADGLSLEVVDAPDRDAAAMIWRALEAFNADHVGAAEPRELAVFLRDAEGDVRGGVVGMTLWGWLHVHLLWVDEGLRGGGWGGRLLAAAEDEARTRGCRDATLQTFDFQAPGFYARHGYAVVGVLAGFPPGHRQLTLRKRLVEDASSGVAAG